MDEEINEIVHITGKQQFHTIDNNIGFSFQLRTKLKKYNETSYCCFYQNEEVICKNYDRFSDWLNAWLNDQSTYKKIIQKIGINARYNSKDSYPMMIEI